MYGWRGWIGRVEPALWTEGPEWSKILPDGIDVTVTCLSLGKLEENDLQDAYQRIIDQVKRLDRANVDVINVGGSPVVSSRGYTGFIELKETLARVTSRPIVTALQAEIEALRALGIQKVAIASPYPHHRNVNRQEILREVGIETVAMAGLGIAEVDKIAGLHDHAAFGVVREVMKQAPDADGIYIPCAGWPVISDIEAIEETYGKPVVTCIQAQAWACLRAMDYRGTIRGFGRLFHV